MAKTAKTTATAGKPQAFQAEVAKLLHLMVHSVYSDRDVFLRELISNASDALDKLRYAAIAAPELLEKEAALAITLSPDKAAKTLTVSDTGIGMTAAELADNLGTIAKSGTQAFMAQAKDSPSLIGQFGVGFYSAFIVAERVEVISRQAGSDDTNVWSSDGLGTFTVTPAPRGPRGTSIVLHLKDDALEFLEGWKIESVVRAYSDHVAHPILLKEDDSEPRQINRGNAIWARARAEVTAEEHKEFFGHLTHSYNDPALTIHYKAEGRHEYTVLLYVPGERPFDLYDPARQSHQKLYVKRVFIADDVQLLPPYLRFVRGVIDSADMPLNLSREMLQNNPEVQAIRKAVTNRVLGELNKLAESDAAKFAAVWDTFGPVIKEGLYEDMERRAQLLDLARFRTTTRASVTLKDYVAGLRENQTAIYYLAAEDAGKAKGSPQLEGYAARGIEVLLLTDPVDSFWVQMVPEFEGKPLKSVTMGAADLDLIPLSADEQSKPVEAPGLAALMAVMKAALGERVKDVRASKRLQDSAVCLVNEGGLDRTLEKYLSRQKDSGVSVSAPVLEVNGSHPLIAALARTAERDAKAQVLNDAAFLLLDQAHVLEGEALADPQGFGRRLAAVMERALG